MQRKQYQQPPEGDEEDDNPQPSEGDGNDGPCPQPPEDAKPGDGNPGTGAA